MSAHQPSLYRETLTFLQIKRKTANGLFPLSLPTLISPPTLLPHHHHQPQHQLWSKQALRSHCWAGRHKRYWLPKSREWCPRLGLGTASSSPPLTLQVDYAATGISHLVEHDSGTTWINLGGPVELQLWPIPFNFFKQTLLASQWKYASLLSEPGICFVKKQHSQA